MTDFTLSQRAHQIPRQWPRVFLLLAALVWWALYQSLIPASEALVAALPVDRDQPPGRRAAVLPLRHAQGAAAAHRGGVRDGHDQLVLHPRAHARAAGRHDRRRCQRDGRQPGHRDAVLLLLGGAAVHRLRAGRRAAGRDLLVPDLGADGQRSGAGAAVRPVRLEDRAALHGPGPDGGHRRRLGHRPPEDGSLPGRLGARHAARPGHGRRATG